MTAKFGPIPMKVTVSKSNHFMVRSCYVCRRDRDDRFSTFTRTLCLTIATIGARGGDFCAAADSSRPPTENVMMSYSEWLATAEASLTQDSVNSEHFYLQLVALAPNT